MARRKAEPKEFVCKNCKKKLVPAKYSNSGTLVHEWSNRTPCDPEALARSLSSTANYEGTWAKV